jgi:L-threonylcarbamoyladenylate synthase
MGSAVGDAVRALEAGLVVVLPTDTVYGLAASPSCEAPVQQIFTLKRRPETSSVALLASSVDVLLECLPELRGRDATIVRALLPGPYTLVLRNSARRFPQLTGDRPDTIGVRVPQLGGEAAEVLERVGTVAATSANLHGGPDPRTLGEVPEEIRSAAGAVLDGGQLPGTASTVIDFTGPEPKVLREGAAPSADAIGRVLAGLD